MRYNASTSALIFSTLLVICLSVGCTSSYWEKQENFLLPKTSQIQRQVSKEIGIATLNTYIFSNDLDRNELKDYPRYAMDGRGWKMVHWHKPDKQEITNILALSSQEDIEKDIKSVLETVKSNQLLIAYAQDTDVTSLSKESYHTYQWIELYFLNLSNKELVHISYGKF